MRRLMSAVLAIVVVALGYAATQVHAADFYDWGVRKEWHDANGEIIGFFYKPCPEDPGAGEPYYWGVREGPATVVDRWMCDPQTMQTPDACEVWYYRQNSDGSGFRVLIRQPCGL